MNQTKLTDNSRRRFLKQSSAAMALTLLPPTFSAASKKADEVLGPVEKISLVLEINEVKHTLLIEPRVTLLDLLRENLDLTGTKKGCDYGQCGACTVHIDGERKLSCLSLAVMQQGKKITTIEGLGTPEHLHPMQQAFITHDGFQCGYCTPGQIMSGIACIKEGHIKNTQEIQEYMSGNICRCGCYPNINAAIDAVQKSGKTI